MIYDITFIPKYKAMINEDDCSNPIIIEETEGYYAMTLETQNQIRKDEGGRLLTEEEWENITKPFEGDKRLMRAFIKEVDYKKLIGEE